MNELLDGSEMKPSSIPGDTFAPSSPLVEFERAFTFLDLNLFVVVVLLEAVVAVVVVVELSA